jgi:hypothetical protein
MAQSANPAPNAPLPDAKVLLERALGNEKKLAAERERYECRVTTQAIETDSKGQTKKDTTEVSDLFYVNGIPIERLLEKNGKDLTADEEHKQGDRVMKETVKYSNQANAQKEENKENQELEDFMQAMMLANGHREMVNGRSVLFYDIVPNPKFQAKNLDQRFARVMQGTVSIEEETGEVIDFNVKSVQGCWPIFIKASGCISTIKRKATGFGLRTWQKARATRAPRSSFIPISASGRQQTTVTCTQPRRHR